MILLVTGLSFDVLLLQRFFLLQNRILIDATSRRYKIQERKGIEGDLPNQKQKLWELGSQFRRWFAVRLVCWVADRGGRRVGFAMGAALRGMEKAKNDREPEKFQFFIFFFQNWLAI